MITHSLCSTRLPAMLEHPLSTRTSAMSDDNLHDRLTALVGCEVIYDGEPYRIIEWLTAEFKLVLQHAGPQRVIQANQFGDATRRVPETVSITPFSSDGTSLDPVVADWLLELGSLRRQR